MPADFIIRPEQPGDIAAITHLTELAFRSHPHSSHTEQFIIQALREAGVLTVSLVAERDTQIIGHIAFSPVQISDGSPHWYGLGPMAVAPQYQRQGIGQALVNAGLAALRTRDAAGCVLLGEPEFYGRFGFRNHAGCILAGVPPAYFLSLPFGPHSATGQVNYHAAFNASS